MKLLWIKLGLLLYLWYELSAELRLAGGTSLGLALLACGAGMMAPRLPDRIAALPRIVLLAGPSAVWFGLAWWVAPAVVGAYPAFALMLAALLAFAGAGARYGVERYSRWFARYRAMLRGLITPGVAVLVAAAGRPAGILTLAVICMLVVMPLRLGWRVIGPIAAETSGT